MLPSSALCCGTAQEAVLDAARVNVPARNGPGVVDACGHGVGGAWRVERGYLAVAIPHETMRPAAVVDSRDCSRGVDAIGKNAPPRTRSIQNGDLSVELPHDAIHRLSIVSIERPYDLPRGVDRRRQQKAVSGFSPESFQDLDSREMYTLIGENFVTDAGR
jgi:hypothetical protein